MLLSEVFEQLFYGELSQTAIGTGSSLSVTHYPRLINYINLGVLALYKRFVLLEKEVIIQLSDDITRYVLIDEHAVTNTTAASTYERYIIDTVARPFDENKVLKILTVFTETGEEYTLNPSFTEYPLDTVDYYVAYTPSQLELQIPYPNSNNTINLICQAAPLNIPSTTTLTTTPVELPDIFLDPLLAFIAERYFVSLSRDKDENIIYPNKFEMACKRIELDNLAIKDHISGTNRFWRNGWV